MIRLDYSNYGIYRKVRNAAWQCLIDNKINRLPVDVLLIAKANGIKLRKNSDVGLLKTNQSGLCFYSYENVQWYIVYDDEAAPGRRRCIIAHELGHILLGHECNNREKEADAFVRLLSPACVLWGLNLHTADEIAAVCDISKAEARKRATRMATLYKRGKFLTAPLEKQVFEQFKGFIEEQNTKKEGATHEM